jgi:hypothetical protein
MVLGRSSGNVIDDESLSHSRDGIDRRCNSQRSNKLVESQILAAWSCDADGICYREIRSYGLEKVKAIVQSDVGRQ